MQMPTAKHPKFWEQAIICEALEARGCLEKGKHGLGMGVGKEQLASVFASLGVNVLATDQDPASNEAKKWDNGQLAKSLRSIYYPEIISKKSFDKLVKYETYDMNTVNDKYTNRFDFIWHDCVIGHLGSMERSVDHLKHSAGYLKPGGWLVFTTELNISSLYHTVHDNSDTIIWRLQDLQELFLDLLGTGLVADRLRLRMGSSELDRRINYNFQLNINSSHEDLINDPNHSEIKIPFSNYALTQVVLCFQKTELAGGLVKKVSQIRKDMQRNRAILLRHSKKNTDLSNYFKELTASDYSSASLIPAVKQVEVTMEQDSEGVMELEFINESNLNIFDFSFNTPYNVAPLVLATAEPVNRSSIFYAKNWASVNRPSVIFENARVAETPYFNLHRAKPKDKFRYRFVLKAPNKPGRYKEKFVLVFEGKAIVDVSMVDIIIKVTKKYTKEKIVTPEKFLQSIGWHRRNHTYETTMFLNWFSELVKNNFRYYKAMRPMSFIVFFKDYFELNFPMIKIPDKVIKSGIKKEMGLIEINTPHLKSKASGRIILVGCNPRVGGTAISHILSQLTGWPHLQADIPNIDFNSIDRDIIIHGHFTAKAFKKLKLRIPHVAITIKRNPLDTLASAFVFAQQAFYNAQWHNREVFEKPIPRGLSINSTQFYKWAISNNSLKLFKSTKSWLPLAKAIISYEEFKLNPAESLQSAIRVIDPSNHYSKKQIIGVVKHVDESFLKDSKNKHRWRGESDYLKRMLPPKKYESIRNFHKKDIQALGYWQD